MSDLRYQGHWYVVDANGIATLCADKADAKKSAMEFVRDYPNNTPYVACQLGPVPAKPDPLTQDEISSITGCQVGNPMFVAVEAIARATEKAHGIGLAEQE